MKTVGKSHQLPSRRLVAAVVLPLLAGGCNRGILDPVGPVGSAEKTILINSTAIMLAIIIPTMIATVAVAWWFRRGNEKAVYRPDWEYSGAIELVVWAIPAMTIMLLGGIAWIGSHQLDPAKPLKSDKAPINVQVVSLDWKWLFIYPDQDVALVNHLVIPIGTPVHFRLTSASVMNTFFVPQLGSMIYVMNGMQTELNLQADREGAYYGMSAHFSGDGFSDMNFQVRALSSEAFGRWASGLQGGGGVLNADGYRRLSEQSSNAQVTAFGHVQGGLFDAVVRQALPPGPGPAGSGSKNPKVRPETSGTRLDAYPMVQQEKG